MNSPFQIFAHPMFGEVRAAVIEDVAWFVGKDVATALGYKDTRHAVKVHVASSDKKEGRIPTAFSGLQRAIVINESGLYSLVFSSQAPLAQEFKQWVTSEVLPSIRKTGSYSLLEQVAPSAPPEVAVVNDNEDSEVIRLKKQLSDLEKFEFAVVYVLLMSNGTVKIGMTKDLTERVKQLKAETGLYVLKFRTTPFMPREEAAELEAKLKEMFAAYCMGGEYFDVKFTLVCAALQ